MSTEREVHGREREAPARADTSTLMRRVAAGALVALGVLFAALNLEPVQINWIFATGNTPLIIVILACLLVGVAVGLMLGRRRTR